MLKVGREHFEELLDYGFKKSVGVYSYDINDNFTIFVNTYISGKGLIEDGIVRIGYTNEDVYIDSEISILDESAELPNVLYDLILAGVIYVGQ